MYQNIDNKVEKQEDMHVITIVDDIVEPREYTIMVPDDHFLSADQIVDDILNSVDGPKPRLPKTVLMAFTKVDSVIQFHHTVGRWIRNAYGLWHDNNPYAKVTHPDVMSMRIIEILKEKLLEKENAQTENDTNN